MWVQIFCTVFLNFLLFNIGNAEESSLVRDKRSTYGHQSDGYGYKKGIYCYQCAYSPPKTYYKKVVSVKHHGYGYKDKEAYGQQGGGYGGYEKSYVDYVPYYSKGGWDKCLKPFDHYEAKKYGIDVWECHGNCYVRKEKNGNIFRGCYKGEFGVNPYRLGCSYQAGALWCFCKGDKCNNGPAPH